MKCNYKKSGGTATLTLMSPPVNALGHELRTDLVRGIESASEDADIRAIIITGGDRAFSGGADITEFGSPKMMHCPNLRDVIAAIEECQKPVIAAISGVCMGGGFELALACHYRIAAPGALISLPEVKLGLLPGAGGTQRLPRVAGVETALNMIISGEAIRAEDLDGVTQVFDHLATGNFEEGVEAFVAKVIAEGGRLPRIRDIKAQHPSPDAYFQFVRNSLGAHSKRNPAPRLCVDCVEAAVRKSFDEGLQVERKSFASLLETSESRAFRHAFLAERAAARIEGVADDVQARPVQKVAVVGAGTMGGGIAMNFLSAGIPVTLLERDEASLGRGVEAIRKSYDAQVQKGKLKSTVMDARMALLGPTTRYEDLADADLIIEAVFESLEVKVEVFNRLDVVAKIGAILATNTSTLDVNVIADATKRPADVLGMHFFSPANVMRLLEVVRGSRTANDVLSTVMKLAKKIGKIPVVSGVCDGFIGNRMLEQYVRQAGFLLDEGCSPAQVDRAIEKFGFAMGPFRMGDMAGNDIGWAIRKRRYQERPDLRYSKAPDLLCELGRFGQKSGAGWYDYLPDRREPVPSSVVDEMLDKHRRATGIAPRRISDEEIVQRLVYSLVNEAALILDEGIAARAGDIDMVYLAGYGFPHWRGGPMRYADEIGLQKVVCAMQKFQKNPHADPDFWRPTPLLRSLAERGGAFTQ